MSRVRAPAGYYFTTHKDCMDNVVIRLHTRQDQLCIGEVELMLWGKKYLETHSHLDTRYHNKKLGALMYAKAIQWALDNGYKIRSSGCGSKQAQAVWRGKTIRKYFNIRTHHYRCPTNAEFHMNPDWDTFFAFRK